MAFVEPRARVLWRGHAGGFAILLAIAIVTSANANWAAPAAISFTVVAVAILVRHNRLRWLQAGVVIGLILQITLSVTDAFADRVSLRLCAKPDLYRRTIGWKEMARLVRQTADASGANSLVADQRDVLATLVYYLRDNDRPILAWPSAPEPRHQFDIDRPLTNTAAEPLLYLSNCPTQPRLETYYSTVESLPAIAAATGPHSSRRLFAFKLSGLRRPISPLLPCAP